MTPILAKIRAAGGTARLVDGVPVVRGIGIELVDELRPLREKLIAELRLEVHPYLLLKHGEKVAFVTGLRLRFLAKVVVAGDPATLAAQQCDSWLLRIREKDGSDVRWFRAHQSQMADYLRLVCPGVLSPVLEGERLQEALLAVLPGTLPKQAVHGVSLEQRSLRL